MRNSFWVFFGGGKVPLFYTIVRLASNLRFWTSQSFLKAGIISMHHHFQFAHCFQLFQYPISPWHWDLHETKKCTAICQPVYWLSFPEAPISYSLGQGSLYTFPSYRASSVCKILSPYLIFIDFFTMNQMPIPSKSKLSPDNLNYSTVALFTSLNPFSQK